jgi:negative regulator of flagellin synthesis FlgM
MNEMKVSNEVQKIIQTYIKDIDRAKSGQASALPTAGPKADTVELSETAADASKAKEIIDQIPDVRQEKVAQIRQEIENGEYNPPPETVAKNMVSHYIIDTLV